MNLNGARNSLFRKDVLRYRLEISLKVKIWMDRGQHHKEINVSHKKSSIVLTNNVPKSA